jgi:beta-lactamase regulating signal transducer with metallopeptidase domain
MMIDVLVKATLVLGVAAVFGAVSRGRAPASVRHAAWVAALLGAVLVPALTAWLPAIRVPLLPAELRPVPMAHASTPSGAPADAGQAAVVPQQRTAPRSAFDVAAIAPASSSAPPMRDAAAAMPHDTREFARRIRDAVSGVPWLTLIWAAGAALVLTRLVASRLAVARLTRSRVPGRKPWLGLARRLARVMRVPRRLRFMRSDRIAMPIACGVLRPTVVLPVEADDWHDGRIRAVLLHELAHVRRRDCLTQLVVDAAVALLWFHPMAWLARRAVRRERERACDDLVLVAGTDAPEYATHLLDVARAAQGQPSRLVMSGGVAMARASELEGRLMAILDTTRARHALTARALLTVTLVAVAIVAPMSALDLWHAPGVAARAVLESPIGRPTPAPKPEAVGVRVRPAAAGSEQQASTVTPAAAPVAAAPAIAGPAPMPTPSPMPTPAVAPMATWQTAADIGPGFGPWKLQGAPTAGLKGGVLAGVPAKPGKARTPADPKIIAALNDALKDTDLEVRQQALFTLGRFGDPSSLDAMIGALGDADADMRQQAAFALRHYDNAKARQALGTALKDANAEVRQQAAFSLGAQRSAEAVDPLLGALKDGDADVRKQAAFALAQIRDPRAADALMVAAKDADAEVRAQAFFGLARLGDPRAQDLAIAGLKDSSPDVRRLAASALASIAGQDK